MTYLLEATIRSLSVGLMTLAAVLISLSVARQRGDVRRDEASPISLRAPSAAALNLEAIRSAGL